MKKGFTLMEILAVMLVIAVIASFLVPAVRSARAEVYYQRAKTAAIKMAEAMRSYYRDTKGGLLGDSVDGTQTYSFGACPADSWTEEDVGAGTGDVVDLFACNYLTWKDFQGLPYTFTPVATSENRSVLVRFTALDDAKAGRYKGMSFRITHDMKVSEEDEVNL
ncbi:MAG: type II secretion system protein [Elusimicrobiaceae bacterium]|nr:type II secretion system protein [Elusimicrobiaceae bacterium]